MTPLIPPTDGRIFIASVDDEPLDLMADPPIVGNKDGVGPMHEITQYVTSITFGGQEDNQ